MKAELKYIHSPDVFDLKNFQPEESDNFGVLMQLILSPKNTEGEESFDVMLCTPKWLLNNYEKDDIIFGKNYLIVFEYNYERIYEKIISFINNVEGNTWDEVANKISAIGKWEFEDYRP